MGAVIGDPEVAALRGEYCALLSRLFLQEADPALMHLLAEGARERARASAEMNELVSEGWFALGNLFAQGTPEEWADRCGEEFLALFVGPGVPRLTPCESRYRSGRAYGSHLALVRAFMERAGLEAQADVFEPEDHLAFEFQILSSLIERQKADPAEQAKWLALQGEFVHRHLGAWAPEFFEEAIAIEGMPFYEAFSKIGKGYVAWEQTLLAEWKPAIPEEELIQIRTDGSWKGPLFDPGVPEGVEIEKSLEENDE